MLSLIFVESALQTGLGMAVGMALAVPALLYLVEVGIDTGALGGVQVLSSTFASVWRAAVTPATFVVPTANLVVLVLLAVTYPALKAARISPVEAMRHQ